MDEKVTAFQTDQLRIKYGFRIVIIGLVLVAVVFLAAIVKWTTASDVAAAVSSVTGVVGTIIGAFFGVQVGSAGKEKAEAARAEAEKRLCVWQQPCNLM
jgi:ABC-type nickel/cobalt efflux system permease component RcnA